MHCCCLQVLWKQGMSTETEASGFLNEISYKDLNMIQYLDFSCDMQAVRSAMLLPRWTYRRWHLGRRSPVDRRWLFRGWRQDIIVQIIIVEFILKNIKSQSIYWHMERNAIHDRFTYTAWHILTHPPTPATLDDRSVFQTTKWPAKPNNTLFSQLKYGESRLSCDTKISLTVE